MSCSVVDEYIMGLYGLVLIVVGFLVGLAVIIISVVVVLLKKQCPEKAAK
jgi:hypothetical protein